MVTTKIKLTYTSVDKLRPYAGNAKQHPESQIENLKRSIQEFGFLVPVIIDNTGNIVAGHGRVLAAIQLGLATVPTINAGFLSERQIRAYRLADNKIAEQGVYDMDKLSEELSALTAEDFDLSLTGFNEQELDTLLRGEGGIFPPGDWESQIIKNNGDAQPQEPQQAKPRAKASDDGYSVFELVMKYENKEKFLALLNEIKQENQFEKLEDAIMHLVENFTP